ncbi:hypothetical protein C0993_001648, partial [Termitomyces sp. T159_Od127]
DLRQPPGLVLHPPQHSSRSPALLASLHTPALPRFGLLHLALPQCSASVYMVEVVTTPYWPPGLSPGSRTPTLPKPPPRPPRAQTATWPTPPAITSHHRPSTPPATATCGIPGHHRPSLPVTTTATATCGTPQPSPP